MLWSSIRDYFKREMKYIMFGVVIVLLLSSVMFAFNTLAMGPFHRTSNAAECRAKYARAKTLTETTTVDFQPYADSTGKRGLRCGFTRSIKLVEIK